MRKFREYLPALLSKQKADPQHANHREDNTAQLRSLVLSAIGEAFDVVHPAALIRKHLQVSDDRSRLLVAGESYALQEIDQILIVGGGKASEAMADAAIDQLRNCGRPFSGVISAPNPNPSHVVVVIDDATNSSSASSLDSTSAARMIGNCVRVIYGGHPIPDRGSELAARSILDAVNQSSKRTLVLALISGGASALLAAPAEGISLADKQKTTALCLRSGAPITALNTLRKHLSRFKGGQLARAASPRPVISLILSDVIGDPLEVIASGPTVPDPSTFADCMKICEQYQLLDAMPQSVREHLQKGFAGALPDTPKPSDTCFATVRNRLIGSAAISAKEASKLLEAAGCDAEIFSSSLQGEAKDVAHQLLYRDLPSLLSKRQSLSRPVAFIATGEYTVTVRGNGKGGRNQEMLLAMLIELKKQRNESVLSNFSNWVIVSAACDGLEGNSPACGAILDRSSLERAIHLKLDLDAALTANNSHSIFTLLGDAICSGPTGTNVNDILIIVLCPKQNQM